MSHVFTEQVQRHLVEIKQYVYFHNSAKSNFFALQTNTRRSQPVAEASDGMSPSSELAHESTKFNEDLSFSVKSFGESVNLRSLECSSQKH